MSLQPTSERDRLLLLMTTRTYRATAFLDAARKLQVPVVVGTERPQVLAAANPAGNLTLPFTRPQEATRLVREFAETYPIKAVVAADDDGVILAALAAEALGLAHNPVAAVTAAQNKYRMRQILAQHDLACPPFQLLSLAADPTQAAGQVPFPCVLKPLSRSASQGVIRANTPKQFVAAFHRIVDLVGTSHEANTEEGEQSLLVEGFLPGIEIALEGLLSQGQLRVLALFDKPDPLDGPFFEETLYVTPSRLPAEVRQRAIQATARAAAALGLCQGPIHAEVRLSDTGAWVLEIAPRSIGGLCSRTLRFGTGVSLEELILRHALGIEVDSLERESQAAGVMMIPIPRGGILRQVRGETEAQSVPGIEEICLTIPVGQEVIPPPEGNRYLGFIFARLETPAGLRPSAADGLRPSAADGVEEALREAHRRLDFEITPRRGDTVEA